HLIKSGKPSTHPIRGDELQNGGLIVTASALTVTHRELINSLAAKHKLPAVASNRVYVTGGVLISYGVDFVDQHRRAAAYVDRILKREKPADLPVQAPDDVRFGPIADIVTHHGWSPHGPHCQRSRASAAGTGCYHPGP